MITFFVIVSIVFAIELVFWRGQRNRLLPMSREELDHVNFFRAMNGKEPLTRG